MIDPTHAWNKSFKPVIIGYLLSILLILAAYYIAVEKLLVGVPLLITVIGIGTVQAILQFIFFFHLGIEKKPRWNLIMFLFMVLVLVIIVTGCIWIMYNLDYYVMPGNL